MTTLLSIGVACALTALIMSLFMRDRARIRQSVAMFVAVLAVLLAQIYPQWANPLAAVAVIAAFAYALQALWTMRKRKNQGSNR